MIEKFRNGPVIDPPLRKPVIHLQQSNPGYCLPACAQMGLSQLGIEVSQTEIARLLGTDAGVGTPFSRIARLAQWGVDVQITRWQGGESLAMAWAADMAVIAAVTTTAGLPGWSNLSRQHAVLVVHMDPEQIVYHNPALPYGPVTAKPDDFFLAWSEMEEQTALLQLQA